MAEIDSLEIKIRSEANDADQSVKALVGQVKALGTALGKVISDDSIKKFSDQIKQVLEEMGVSWEDAMKNIKAQSNDVQESINNVSQSVQNASDGVKKGSDDIAQSFTKISDSFKELQSSKKPNLLENIGVIKASNTLVNLRSKIDATLSKYKEQQDKIKEMEASGVSDKNANNYGLAVQKLKQLETEYDTLIAQQEQLAKKGGFTMNLDFSGMVKDVREFASGLAKVTMNFTKMLLPIGAIKKIFQGLGGTIKKLTNSFSRLYKMFRLMIIRSGLRELLKYAKDGFTNLIYYSDRLDANISLLWNSMRQLGNSISALVEPLINYLTPALNTVIQYCISASNAINQLIASLTGNGTWIRAKELTDDYRDSLDKTSGSAKKLKSYLLGIDELNVIAPDDGGSGSKQDAIDYESMFETLAIDKEIADFAEKIKKAYRNADFTEVGEIIAKEIKIGLESINWDSINIKSENIAKSIATGINGLVGDSKVGYEIGKALANVLNTGFAFVRKFKNELDWDKLGEFIGAELNGFFKGLNWSTIHDATTGVSRGIAELINSAINEFDWNNVSTTLANFSRTFADTLTEFFGTVEWDKLGEKISEQLKNLLTDRVTIRKLGNAVGSAIQALYDLISGFISKLDVTAISNAFFEFFGGVLDTLKDAPQLATLFSVALSAIIIKGIGKIAFTEVGKAISKRIASAIAGTLSGAISSNSAEISSAISSGINSATSGKSNMSIGSLVGGGLTLGIGITALVGIAYWKWEEEELQKSIDNYYNSDAHKEFQRFASQLKESYDLDVEIHGNIEDRLGNISALTGDLEIARNLIEEIFSLDSKENKTADEVDTLRAKIKILNGMDIDGIHIDLDPDGKLIQNESYLTKIVEHLEDEIRLQGLIDASIDNQRDYAKAIAEKETAEKRLTDATQKLKENEEFLLDMQKAREDGWDVFVSKGLVEKYGDSIAVLAQKEAELRGEFENANTALEVAKQNITDLKSEHDSYIEQIKDAQKDIEDYTAKVQGMGDALAKVREDIKFIAQNSKLDVGVNYHASFAPTKAVTQAFAGGGFPSRYSTFIAGEDGKAELLGTVGGKTAVAGGAEITGIADAVYATGEQESSLLANAVSLLQKIASKDTVISISDRDIARANLRGQNSLGSRLITAR